jgi:hypothetical protein
MFGVHPTFALLVWFGLVGISFNASLEPHLGTIFKQDSNALIQNHPKKFLNEFESLCFLGIEGELQTPSVFGDTVPRLSFVIKKTPYKVRKQSFA